MKKSLKIDQILILDIQISGLDPNKDAILEVACIRYSLVNLTSIETHSWILNTQYKIAADDHINGITKEILEYGTSSKDVWGVIENLAMECSVVMSVNSDSTKLWVEKFVTLPNWIDDDAPLAVCSNRGIPVCECRNALDKCQLLVSFLTRYMKVEKSGSGIMDKASVLVGTCPIESSRPLESKHFLLDTTHEAVHDGVHETLSKI